MHTAVAFIIFNRPDLAARVFSEIAKVNPPKLFVIADGPRDDHPDDMEKCAATCETGNRVDLKNSIEATHKYWGAGKFLLEIFRDRYK